MKQIADNAGRWLDVSPARFPGWIAGFAQRHAAGAAHPALTAMLTSQNVIFSAPDGAVAECHPPFPPVPALIALAGAADSQGAPAEAAACADVIAAHALAPRTVGVLLVRLGGYAVGVFAGSPPRLEASKTGSRPVHGRSAAGGWSQHRFARRRDKQATEALQAAAEAAVGVFGRWTEEHGTDERQEETADNSNKRQRRVEPDDNSNKRQRRAQPLDNSKKRPGDGRDRSGYQEGASVTGADSGRGTGLDAVVLGGDKRAVAELRGDPRLLSYLELATDRFLSVPDPKLAVLKDAPRLYLAVRIRLREPAT